MRKRAGGTGVDEHQWNFFLPTVKVAKELNDPANPAIMDVNTMLSSGPGLPAVIV